MKKYANKFKAIFVLLLALAFVLPFAACGDNEETTGGGGGGGGSDAPDEYWVESIEVEKTEDFREDYSDGEVFDKTGLIVTAYWNDGYVETVDPTKYTVSPSVITADVTEVTVIYGDASEVIPINSIPIVGLDIVRMPSNTTYFVGETFKPDGMVLCYKLEDGSTREIVGFAAADVTFSAAPFEDIGDAEIEVTYNGYSCKIPVVVMGRGFKIEANSTENITITDPPEGTGTGKKAKPGENQSVMALASNGDYMMDFQKGNVMTFTFESDTPQVRLLLQGSSTYVTQYGKNADDTFSFYPIVVKDMQVSRIFDMTVNGTSVPINAQAVLEGAETDPEVKPEGDIACLANWTEVDLGIVNVYTDKVNSVTLTFKDNGYRLQNRQTGEVGTEMPAPYIDYFMISNIEDDDNVVGIEITKEPTDKEYIVGQRFDGDGMEVTAELKSGEKKVVTANGVSPAVFSEVGDSVPVTIYYGGFTETVTVKVIDRAQTGITVVTPPDKTVYITGEPFDPTGMAIGAVFNDGSTEPLVSEGEEPAWTYSPTGALAEGKNTITITSGEYETTFEVTARRQTGVKITTPPTVTEYANGMPFDPAGMVVVAVYSDGSEEPVTDYTVEPSGGLTVGTDKVTVRHNGFTAEQPVTVTGEEVISHIAISGVPTDAIAAGSPLPALSAGDITVTAHYFSGKTETLSASEYDLVIPTGNAEFGSAVTATLKADGTVRAVMPFNVSSEINITDGMVTGGKNYRTNVAWADDAKNGDFVQGCIGDSVITFTFDSASDCNAKLTLTGASGWVLVYNSTPVELGDMVAAEMFDLEVNGNIVTIDPDAKFSGGNYGTPSNENLAVWSDAELGTFRLKEGENTVRLIFKNYEYRNGNESKSLATPNLDYLTISAVA